MADEPAEKYITDSIEVKGIQTADELLYLNVTNDSMLYGFDRMESMVNLYQKQNSHGQYQKIATEQLTQYDNPVAASFVYNKEGDVFYYIDGSKQCIEVLDRHFKTIYEHRLHYTLPFLGKEYMLYASKISPLVNVSRDTILLTKFYKEPKDYLLFTKERPLTEMALKKDTIPGYKELMSFPVDYSKYFPPMQMYCYADHKIWMIYPDYDKVYIFDRATGVQKEMTIGNKDFVKPAAYDFSKRNSPDFTKYQSQRDVRSFRYWGIFFNEHTRHFILFYKMPALSDNKEETMVSIEEQALHAIILDQDLTIINYLSFKTAGYFFPTCFMKIPGKGLAIPLFSKTIPVDQTVRFYIFDL